jgi:methylglutaconyl-CoA hydratase
MARRKSPVSSPTYATLDVAVRNGVGIVTLNRPEVRNAFNETLVAELTLAAERLGSDPGVRALVLAGNGASFCAGADLNWMKKMAGYGRAENLADANALARMLKTLHDVPKPTLARIHGAAMGGGVGLAACCDIAVADVAATFALSEVKLGLIPATISPYVINAIGARAAGRYFLTGERFTAADAYRMGLVHDIAPLAELDGCVNALLGALMLAGPQAQRECKTLIRAVAQRPLDAKVIAATARHIARVRASPEGREGVAAFLGKRHAAWVPAELRERK